MYTMDRNETQGQQTPEDRLGTTWQEESERMAMKAATSCPAL